jgi:hypothetical protein
MTEDMVLTDDETRALADCRRDLAPPRAIEPRVVMDLRQRGLLAPAGRDWAKHWRAIGTLGACAGLAIGLWLGETLVKPSRTPPPGAGSAPRFMLLLYEDAAYQPAVDPSDRVREYRDWAKSLGQAGQLVAADELGDHGEELKSATVRTSINKQQVAGQPRGYFVISAGDEAAAARIASTCPHLRHGGRIVMLPIVP